MSAAAISRSEAGETEGQSSEAWDPVLSANIEEDGGTLQRVTMPYGKFGHGIFRTAALMRHAVERRLPNPIGLGAD